MQITQETFDRAFTVGEPRHSDDCERIARVGLERLGVRMTLLQAEAIWQDRSDNYSAGWLLIEDDDEIERVILVFVGSRVAFVNEHP